MTAPVNDVGIARASNVDAAHDVPDELQVDFGDDDTATRAHLASGYCHEGLRPIAEIDWAEIGATLTSYNKRVGVRKVCLAPQNI